jgi:hypothetical protein
MDSSVSLSIHPKQLLHVGYHLSKNSLKLRERGLARFYILLDDEITQENSEREIRKFLAPYRVDFPKTEWFSTFESMNFCLFKHMICAIVLTWFTLNQSRNVSQGRISLLVAVSFLQEMLPMYMPSMVDKG